MPERLFVAFKVLGEAQPSGSKTSYAPVHPKTKKPYYKNGRIVINTVDACKKSGPWKATVAKAAKEAMREKKLQTLDAHTEGYARAIPLKFIARFYQTRPGTHYRTGKFSDILRDDAPLFPTAPADVLKLARSVEDACAEVVFKDDSAIVREIISKEFGREDCIEVEIWIIE